MDLIGLDTTLVVPFVVTGVGFATLLVAEHTGVMLIGVVLVGLGITWPGVLTARFMDLFEAKERGTGFGLSRTIYVFLGSLGNVTTGTLAEIVG